MVHSIIISGILLCCLLFAGPIFNSIESVPGEAQLRQVVLPAETNNIRFNIEKLSIDEDIVNMSGWAFVEGHDSSSKLVCIILSSDKETYIFDTYNCRRPDVTSFFKDMKLNLDKSGFSALLPAGKINSGVYKIGIYVEKDDTKALAYTGKILLKSEHYGVVTIQ